MTMQIDWAAWGSTILTLLLWIFFGGVAWNKLMNHSETLKDHGVLHEETRKDVNRLEVKVGMLEAWKDGYAAARAVYDRSPQHTGGD